MGLIKWYADKIQKVKGLDTPIFVMFVALKALGGMAIGIIIAPYVGNIGWWVLLAAFILAIPVMIKIFAK